MYDLKRLGTNIRYLRKAHGETQEELGFVLDVGKNTISYYENGERKPDEEKLSAIAHHYMVSIDDLAHQDLSNIGKLHFDNKVFFRKIDEILPLVSSDIALNNKSFQKAFIAHKAFYSELEIESMAGVEQIEDCFEGYFEAENDETARYESAANFISLTFLFHMIFKNIPSVITNPPASLLQIAKTDKSAKKVIYDPDPDLEEDFEEALTLFNDEEFQDKMDEYKYLLKHSAQYSELADYYLALQYVWNLVENGLSADFNRRLGIEMLNTLISVKNIYAARYVLFCREAAGLESSQSVDDK